MRLLSRAVVVAALAGVAVGVVPGVASAGPAVTQNGYPVLEKSDTVSWSVNGVGFRTAPGRPTKLLQEFVRWFDRNVEPVSRGPGDDWSWSPPRQNKLGPSTSNHASGTAVDLNATLHPLGESGTFTPRQRALIREKVREYGGELRWGGDYSTPDDMLFEVQRKR